MRLLHLHWFLSFFHKKTLEPIMSPISVAPKSKLLLSKKVLVKNVLKWRKSLLSRICILYLAWHNFLLLYFSNLEGIQVWVLFAFFACFAFSDTRIHKYDFLIGKPDIYKIPTTLLSSLRWLRLRSYDLFFSTKRI